ncbi:MAG TPA: ATP-binding protein [Verrucomicrobiae bacterium]|nr:ATP-binding protein [Verrucomicrobiae bacterium]
MASLRWFIMLGSALFMLPENGPGEGAVHWSIYKTTDGLAESAYNSLSLTPQGQLLAINVNSPVASALDGYSVRNFSFPFKSIERVSESPGGQLWAACPGKLFEQRNGVWAEHSLVDIVHQTSLKSLGDFVPELLAVRQSSVILLFPDCVVEFSDARPGRPETTVICSAAQLAMGQFTGMALSSDGALWICGEHGSAKAAALARNLTPAITWQIFRLPATERLGNLSTPEPDDEGGVTFIAESSENHSKVAVTLDGNQWLVRASGAENFFCAWRGPNRTFWAASRQSLFQWDDAHSNWVENQEFSPGQIFDATPQPDGSFWLSIPGELIRGSAPLWESPETIPGVDSPVQSAVEDSQNRLCFVADRNFYILANGATRPSEIPLPADPSPNDALYPLQNGAVLLRVGDALFDLPPGDRSFKPLESTKGAPAVPLGILADGNVCLYQPAKSSFNEFDGVVVHPMEGAPPMDRSGEKLVTLFVAQNGGIWIGGNRILWRQNNHWRSVESTDQPGPKSAVAFAQMIDGTILCATLNEIWAFTDNKGWTLLQSGFNHIYGLMLSHDNSMWVASNGGLFRFYKGAWLENGAAEDLPDGPVRAVCEDQLGRVWAATIRGLRVFYPEAHPDPPRTFVRRLGGKGNFLSEGNALDLLLEGHDKWKFTSPQRLLYSYQLDTTGWSPFQNSTTISFPSLGAGRHTFQVLAIDTAGNVESSPTLLDFTVTVPWFKDPRLWVISILGLGIAGFFGAVALNRHRQLLRSHAAVERKVAERSRELEIATRELLHSQKMNALGTLAAGIAHDFNNILSIIKGSAQIIEDNLDSPEKIRTRVNRINTLVQQGAEIVDAMLGFSRNAEALSAPSDLNAIVADTLKLLGDRFLRTVQVKFEPTEKLPEVLAPRELIQQILLNFIFNAAEAMTTRKEITVVTGVADKLPSDIFLSPGPGPPFVLVSVRDVGTGIAPEIMSRIFEPFFTTKALSARRGTGLGLSMVYEMARKMGAGLAVQSVTGGGSTFTLILPVSKQAQLVKTL